MAAAKLLLALMVASAAITTAFGQKVQECSDDDVANKKQYCLNCMAGVECKTAGPIDDEANITPLFSTCPSGEACIVFESLNTASCVPVDQSPCSCGSGSVSCDNYDPNTLLVCTGGSPVAVSKCADGESCMEGTCEAATTTTTAATTTVDPAVCGDNKNKWVAVTPACKAGAFCGADSSVLVTETCDEGEYFDSGSGACTSSAPVPCAGTCTGNCPDVSNCSIYYVCDGKGNKLDDNVCAAGTFFNPTNGTCSITSETDCTVCDLSDIFTTPNPSGASSDGSSGASSDGSSGVTSDGSSGASSDGSSGASSDGSSGASSDSSSDASTSMPAECTEANLGDNYAAEAGCTKRYYSCRKSGTTYKYVLLECYSTLYFSRDRGTCYYKDQIPECN